MAFPCILSVILKTYLQIQVYFAQKKKAFLIIILVTNTDTVQTVVVEIYIDGNHEHSQGK